MLKNTLSLDEIKKIELDILKFIDKTCAENHLKYFLAYGTLLGAIRHNGFIPWDDDIDIYMLREDYEKLIKILGNRQDDRYKLLHLTTDPNYYYEFAKIVDSNTEIEVPNVIKNPAEGIWVDIFPLDKVASCKRLQHVVINALVGCRALSVYTKFPSNRRSKLFYPLWIISKAIGPRFFLNIIERICKSGKSNKYLGAIAAVGGSYYYPTEYFSSEIKVPFEDMICPAPIEYKRYLEGEYGDYMQLPPEDKRVCHPMESYLK